MIEIQAILSKSHLIHSFYYYQSIDLSPFRLKYYSGLILHE